MKYPNFSMSPIVIGFGENNLKKRIIAIMNFKKPTALTTALSAFLVIGVVSTGAFAAAPKTEDPVTVSEPEPVVSTSEPIVTTSEPAITASEPVSVTDPTDNNSETGEPEPIDLEKELEIKYPRGEHSIPIFPEDKNGIYYSESGDVIRVPVYVLNGFEKNPSHFGTNVIKNDKGTWYVHAIVNEERHEYFYLIYFGDEFAVMTRNESIWKEQITIYCQMQYDGNIPYEHECFHDLNSLD